MTDLPNRDLFPIIHPLQKPAQETLNKIPSLFYEDLRNNYEFHLPRGYMTPEKLDTAIEQLRKLKVLETYNIDKLLKKYDITDCKKQEKCIKLDDEQKCAIFWLVNSAAFLMLNKYMETKDQVFLCNALVCFRNAELYKFEWNKRSVRRNGGSIRAQKIKETKDLLHSVWNDYLEEDKLIPQKSARILEKYKSEHINEIPYDQIAYSTLLGWCRMWKKECKQEHHF